MSRQANEPVPEPTERKKVLPSNAYTPLAPGETYIPVVPAQKEIPEVTPRSLIYGVIMAGVFTFAAAFLGLKTGNVIEAAIPIAILAVFFGKLHKRRNTILENVIIQSIGASSGAVVAGVIFVVPALYILKLDPTFFHTFVAAILGGFLGILFLIPLRRYFVAEEHGTLPFPEATATTEIIATGEGEDTGQGKVLLVATGIGGAFDFIAETVHGWNMHLTSSALLGNVGERLDRLRIVLKVEGMAALMGLGYIIGIKYAAIILAGSVLAFLVMTPLVYHFGAYITQVVPPAKGMLISQMGAEDIWGIYVRKIGIGCIAMAGIIGIIKMGRIIVGSFSLGFKEIFRGKEGHKALARTDRDLSARSLITLIGVMILAVALAFLGFISTTATDGAPFGLAFTIKITLIGLAIVIMLSFLFTSVAARAIAVVGTNPVSGMTLITLILSAVVLGLAGLTGRPGMFIALVMGCVVGTALSMSGSFITDLKIGYWIGATPQNQQRWKFLGTAASALAVCGAMLLIERAYGFTLADGSPNPAVPAPQGNLMAVIISGVMSGESQPYLLYSLGILTAILLEMCAIPPLAFGLGMYLPFEINMTVFIGGCIAWLVGRSSRDRAVSEERKERGTLIASGLIAGGALMGIVGAVMRLDVLGVPARHISVGAAYDEASRGWLYAAWYQGWFGQALGLILFLALCWYTYADSCKVGRKG